MGLVEGRSLLVRVTDRLWMKKLGLRSGNHNQLCKHKDTANVDLLHRGVN